MGNFLSAPEQRFFLAISVFMSAVEGLFRARCDGDTANGTVELNSKYWTVKLKPLRIV